jgi:hypothetical protein
MTKGFGNPKNIQGRSVSADSTLVPMEILRELRPRRPYPVTVTTTVFTLVGSVTHKIPIWNGSDVMFLDESLAYTWVVGSNAILSSAGVETTNTGSLLGTWYYYVSQDADGTYEILPSQTGPSEVQTRFPNGGLAHPGLSVAKPWTYVGFSTCDDATTPTHLAATKIGYQYHVADVTNATTSTWAQPAFTNAKALPKLGALGGLVGGYLEVGAGASVTIGSTSSASVGQQTYLAPSASGAAYAPFGKIPMTADGKIWTADNGTRGDVHITIIQDVV